MNKKEKKEKCREILYSNKEISKKNQIFLVDVFKNHREWNVKKGVGVDYIYVDVAHHDKSYNQKCFYIARKDGSVTDISYNKSIHPPSKFTDISTACRYSVKEEIEKFKTQNIIFGITKCAITNTILKYDETHIDHYDLDFEDLVKYWLKEKNVNEIFKSINTTKDLTFETFFTKQELNSSFIEFHNSNTNLRAVTANANLTRKKTTSLIYE
jgi:hypothetical protein